MPKSKLAPIVPPTTRPPVIVVMGHIDHGKSSLLDYIRKANVVAKEAGGITQHISAYAFEHKTKDGKSRNFTFLDTPGHEAFGAMRMRGAKVADIAILVVSAEDGFKPQTQDAYNAIKNAGIPFVVAINKIDKPNANIERTKQSLAEHEIYVEGYGGDVSWAGISAKTGEGVNDLLDILMLVADIADLKSDPKASGEGVIIEANMDPKKGSTAVLIVTVGTIHQGTVVVAEGSLAPVRIMENFLGKPIKTAVASDPVRITGWSSVPSVGSIVKTFEHKREAEKAIETWKLAQQKIVQKQTPSLPTTTPDGEDITVIPVVLKSDVLGTLEAMEHEIVKLHHDRVRFKIVTRSVGAITEGDIKAVIGTTNPLVIGFHTKIEPLATDLAERQGVTVKTFSIIYEMTEWLASTLIEKAPKREVEKNLGELRIIKVFSQQKEKQVIGGRVQVGRIALHDRFKIIRRDQEVGEGKIIELQQARANVKEVTEGLECGMQIESKISLAERDIIRAFARVVE